MKKFLGKLESKLDSSSSSPSASSGAPPPPSLSSPPSRTQLYRYREQAGVNLGSWFSLEGWLSPSIFDQNGTKKGSEMDLLEKLGPEKAREVLEKHWDGWVNEGDWKWMSAQGINTVRLPLAYYHFLPGSPSSSSLTSHTEYEKYTSAYTGAWQRIVAAIQTAAKYDIGVLIDLHGAPGAQNGEGHSGLSGGKAGLWDSKAKQRKTIEILVALVGEVQQFENVVGVELLNEPKNSGGLQGFYEEAIKAIRGKGSDMPLYVSDSWDLSHYSGWAASQSNSGNFIVVDHHLYRCFTPQDHSTPATEHVKRCQPGGGGPTWNVLSGAASQLGGSLIIGEWSSALNPGSLQGQDQGEAQRQWGQAQMAAYTQSGCGGSMYWTLKKEGKPDAGWCLYTALEQGVLPARMGRPSLAKLLGSDVAGKGKQAQDAAFSGHSNYWNGKGAKGDHAAFAQGFEQGWKDSVAFAQASESLIGFRGQWAKQRAEAWKREGGDGGQAWEFEHGCRQAIEAFKAAAMQT